MIWTAVLIVSAPLGAIELKEDPPTFRPPHPGKVIATVRPAAQVSAVSAVSRVTRKKYTPTSFDPKTGRAVFEKLPGDARYDLIVLTRDGRRFEGIDLDFVDRRLLRLADRRRKELDLPPERGHKFTQKDAQALVKWVKDLDDFMDIRRVLYVQGHGRRATLLVELMRGRDFYSQAGDQVIWRVELWYFEYQFGGWERIADQERVLERRRIPRSRWEAINVEYRPQLSGYVHPDGRPARIQFDLPKDADVSRGRIRRSQVKLKTTAHVLGLDVKPKPPATTQPVGKQKGGKSGPDKRP